MVASRRERKKIAARSQILSAAIDLFSRRGIDAVTIDEIAAAADVGKGTIYNYFATKEDIVVAFMADLEARIAPTIARSRPGTRPVDRVLADYILLHFRLKAPYHAFVRVFLAQMFLDTERFLPYMVEMQKHIDPPLQSLFAALERRQALRAGIDLPRLILSFKTMHLGLTALWAVEGPPFEQTTRLVRHQMQFFTEGISRKAQ
ncbi:MAG TPA: TetR/AcrR family transcriptional regulator [Bryobacteraceae bacterium]|nr:TetR/AcrR family transcriptional regulator [Bryobacteraceae bacterium]